MKQKSDPRHIRRTKLMQELFTWDFRKGKPPINIAKIVDNLAQIDELIIQCAPGRPIKGINSIDLAILRLSTYELIIKKDAPPKVVIDEAVELGKEFGSDSSPSFINGALGKLLEIKNIVT